MKYATLALLGIGLAVGTTLAQGQAPASKGEPELKTVEQKFAYAVGIGIGKSMKQQGLALEPDLVAKGIKDGLADKSMFTDQQLFEIQQAFQKVMMEAEAKKQAAAGPLNEKNLKDGQAFLEANKSKPGIKTTASGLQYKVLKAGTGKSPKLTDSVEANYRGTLIDGTEFDSSVKNGGPITFGVTDVIKGWTEILQLMKEGDKWLVFIPANLAYDTRPRGALIKPNSALIFEMELVKVISEK